MKVVVTGTAGHLGEALARLLTARGDDVVGIDIVPSECTTRVGSITDRAFVSSCLSGATAVFHAAALHKPHVATHSMEEFAKTNVTGTVILLEESRNSGTVGAFVFTSTTSAFGSSLVDPLRCVWIDESVSPVPKNIYGATKTSAETMCRLFHATESLPCIVLRTSRFFLEEDDNAASREAFPDGDNLKVLELLQRRGDIEDIADAHVLAAERLLKDGRSIPFHVLVVSATTPFERKDAERLHTDAEALIRERFSGKGSDDGDGEKVTGDDDAQRKQRSDSVDAGEIFEARGWRFPASVDRVYDNSLARRVLGWEPKVDFASALRSIARGGDWCSELARQIGSKSYH